MSNGFERERVEREKEVTSKVFPRTESGGKGPKAGGVEYYNDGDNAYGDNNTIMMTRATLFVRTTGPRFEVYVASE